MELLTIDEVLHNVRMNSEEDYLSQPCPNCQKKLAIHLHIPGCTCCGNSWDKGCSKLQCL